MRKKFPREVENYILLMWIWYISLRNLEIRWIKIIEDIEDLNITINWSNLINIYNLAQTIKEYIFFLTTHGTFTKIDQNSMKLNKHQSIDIIEISFFDHNTIIKLSDISNKMTPKSHSFEYLKTQGLNNLWFKN